MKQGRSVTVDGDVKHVEILKDIPYGQGGIRNHILILSGIIYENYTAERVAATIDGAVAINS